MNFLPDWAPGIHPLIIHFPIAIIAIALLADLLTLFFKAHQFKLTVLFLYTAGAISALVSFLSGRAAADSLNIPEGYYDVFPVISAHADLALIVIIFFGLYALLRTFLYTYGWDQNKYVLLGSLILGAAGYIFVFQTAEKGAELVYRYGVGTKLPDQVHEKTDTRIELKNIIQKENGSWNWNTHENPVSILTSQFSLKSGDINNLKLEEQNGFLSINLLQDGEYIFTYDGSFSDVVLEAEVNIDSLQGHFSLVHHINDSTTFDFFELKGNKVKLGRSENNKTTVFDQNPYSSKGWIFLKAVGTKGHFRGYIDNELLVHGHGKDLPNGKTGFGLSGKGKIKLKYIKAEFIKD